MARNLLKIFSETPDLDRVQAQVDQSFRTLNNHPLLKGTQVAATLATGSLTRVAHGLGRSWTGWFLIDKRQEGEVWSVTGAGQNDRYLTLSGSLGGPVQLWIF